MITGFSLARGKSRLEFLSLSICLSFFSTGCGYTTRSGLSPDIKSVYVRPFENKIDMSQGSSEYQRFPVYQHAMEVEITNAVINQFQLNGLLRPVGKNQADSVLEGELVEFRRDALSFGNSDEIQQWRLNVVANIRFFDLSSKEELWQADRLTGDYSYITEGPNAETEDAALQKAIQDLARRVVDRVSEYW